MAKTKLLVLCVDRDDDLGIKAKIKGPVVGRDAVLKAATKLGLADPEDSDLNAIFEALRVYDSLPKDVVKEVAVVTGSNNLGLESDMIIKEQLEEVLKKFPADEIIFVSDGAADEQVMPIINNMARSIYIDRIVVKQNPKLESAYFVIYNFLKEIASNPKSSRVFFGVPALALLLYALFGSAGWRLILGTVAAYLFVKGFQLEDTVNRILKEFVESLTKVRPSLVMYVTSITFFVVGVFMGMTELSQTRPEGVFEMILRFVNASSFAFGISAISWSFGAYLNRKIKRFASLISLSIMLAGLMFIAYTLSEFLLDRTLTIFYLLKGLAGAGFLIFLAGLIESSKKRG